MGQHFTQIVSERVRLCSTSLLFTLAALILLVGAFTGNRAFSQDPSTKKVPEESAMVQLNFPQEIPIQALVDNVSQQLNINILYDKEIGDQQINIKAPQEIPAESLLGVLQSALKVSGLALVDTAVPNWKKIVRAEQLPNVAPAGDAEEMMQQYGDTTAVTQAFVLKHAKPEEVDALIKPFLTQPGSNSVSVPRSNTLIVTDYGTSLVKIAKWIEYIDQPKADVTVEFLPIEHQSVSELTTQLTSILSAKSRVRGAEAMPDIEIVPDEHTNQMLLIGPQANVEEVKQLATALDKPLGLVTKTYQFRNVRASKIDELVRALLTPGAAERQYRSVTDDTENLLVVTAPSSVHEQIGQLREVRDVPIDIPESPIRFYKIKNLPVQELLETLHSIESNTYAGFAEGQGWNQLPTDGRIRPARPYAVPGPNRMPSAVGEPDLPVPPAVVEPPETAESSALGTTLPTSVSGDLLGRARISGDVHTNALIIVAEPSVHRVYEELIKKLDQPRPQVMVEAKFVIVDTSDDFSLGIEVSGGDRKGLKRLFAFTSYGLSTVDPVNGALALIPGLGFNGTLVDPDTADVVTRSLVTNRRARVTSAPRILVSDNATGQLTSVEEVPFTSVNASQTVATTSFAGFTDAGTTITVTPRIRDERSLQMDIAITVNTFTGAGAEGIPPPRQTEEVTSQVIVPDGHTIILGGLNRGSKTYAYTGLPLLDRIPIVREATGLTSTANANSSMFIFLRPVILQDDKFKDLKYISDKDVRRACLPRDYPGVRPIWMR